MIFVIVSKKIITHIYSHRAPASDEAPLDWGTRAVPHSLMYGDSISRRAV